MKKGARTAAVITRQGEVQNVKRVAKAKQNKLCKRKGRKIHYQILSLSLHFILFLSLACIPSLFHLVGWTEKGARNQGNGEREVREVSCARAINRN